MAKKEGIPFNKWKVDGIFFEFGVKQIENFQPVIDWVTITQPFDTPIA